MGQVHTILSGMVRNVRDKLTDHCIFQMQIEPHRIRLIWVRFKTKERIWFFVWHAVNLWSSLLKDVSYKWLWKQTGKMPGREICSCLLVGLPLVPELENLWLKVGRSPMFLFFSLAYMSPHDHSWKHNMVSPCSEAVLCSFLYYILFLYTFF